MELVHFVERTPVWYENEILFCCDGSNEECMRTYEGHLGGTPVKLSLSNTSTLLELNNCSDLYTLGGESFKNDIVDGSTELSHTSTEIDLKLVKHFRTKYPDKHGWIMTPQMPQLSSNKMNEGPGFDPITVIAPEICLWNLKALVQAGTLTLPSGYTTASVFQDLTRKMGSPSSSTGVASRKRSAPCLGGSMAKRHQELFGHLTAREQASRLSDEQGSRLSDEQGSRLSDA